MKTRRILAASTAALLAFGTTAAYVASAAAAATNAVAWTASANKTDGAATAGSDIVVTIDGLTGLAAATDIKGASDTNPSAATNWQVVAKKASTALTTTTAFVEAGKITVTIGSADAVAGSTITVEVLAAADASDWAAASTVKTLTIAVAAATDDNTSDTSEPDYTDLNKVDEEKAVDIGDGVKIKFKNAKDAEKFGEEKYENYKMTASAVAVVPSSDQDKEDNPLTETGDTAPGAIKGLSKSLKNEIKKIRADRIAIYDISVADGNKKANSTPVPVKVTVNVDFEVKYVYHKNGENLEGLKAEVTPLIDDTYDVTFETKSFSPFILTNTEIKNAKNAASTTNTETGEETSGEGTSTTNPDTGIALAIAPVVLAAGAVAVVALKKKH